MYIHTYVDVPARHVAMAKTCKQTTISKVYIYSTSVACDPLHSCVFIPSTAVLWRGSSKLDYYACHMIKKHRQTYGEIWKESV